MVIFRPQPLVRKKFGESRPSPLLKIFLACAALRLLAAIPFVIDDDEAWWAASAISMRTPADFYFSVVDDKPPGNVWFCWVVGHLLGPVGSDPRVIRAVFVLLTIGAAWLLGRMARKLACDSRSGADPDRAAWLASTLFLVATAIPSPKLLAFTADGLVMLFVIAGYALALFGTSPASAILAGAVLGGGLLVKQTGVFAAIPILFSAWPRRWRVTEWACMLAGALLVLVPSVWVLNPSEMFYWTWTYPTEVLISVREEIFSGWLELAASVAGVGFALLPLATASARLRPPGGWLRDFRFQWLIAGGLTVAIGRGLFLHYFLMVVPPLALLAADAFSRRKMAIWEKLWLGLGYAASCALVTLPVAGITWGTDLPYYESLNAALKPALRADDRLLVWGGSALPLIYAHARHVSRFVIPRFAAAPYGTERTQGVFHAELARDPPSVIVDLHERGDNQFDNPLESDFAVATLAKTYHLYLPLGVPWAKFYFRDPRTVPGLVEVKGEFERKLVYKEYPSRNPAWKDFQKALVPLSRPKALNHILELDRALREEEALELISLQSQDYEQRARAGARGRELLGRIDSGNWTSFESGRISETMEGPKMPLSLSMPGWWFSVSLAQLQPRYFAREPSSTQAIGEPAHKLGSELNPKTDIRAQHK